MRTLFLALALIGPAARAADAEPPVDFSSSPSELDALLALPDDVARIDWLLSRMAEDPDLRDRYAVVVATLQHLHDTDARTRRAYLAGALADLAPVRWQTLLAARAGAALDDDGRPFLPPRGPASDDEALVGQPRPGTDAHALWTVYNQTRLRMACVPADLDRSSDVTVLRAMLLGGLPTLVGAVPTAEPQITWGVVNGLDQPLPGSHLADAFRGAGLELPYCRDAQRGSCMTRDQTESYVTIYNARLRARLGLAEEQVMLADLQDDPDWDACLHAWPHRPWWGPKERDDAVGR